MTLQQRVARRLRRWFRGAELRAVRAVESIAGPASDRVVPRRLRRSSPRCAPAEPGAAPPGLVTIDPEIARPVHLPVGCRGSSMLTGPPPTAPRALRRLVSRAQRRCDVQIPAEWTAHPVGAVALLTLGAAGATVRLSSAPDDATAIGPNTLAALTAPPSANVGCDLRSVRLRRAVLHEHSPRAVMRGPADPFASISVLLPSRRPDDVLHAVEQVARQRDCDVELLVGLHGPGFPETIEHDIAARWPGDLHVARVPAEAVLGDVLDELSATASRELVTKWDDDDWYGTDHLLDLVIAYDYSGADVVGKFAEFVHLERAELTVRRSAVGSETYSTAIAGGTLLTSTEWLRRIGGWAPVPRDVDLRLLDATRAAGGRSYRTHGYQYVLRRRGDVAAHTWSASPDYFVDGAVDRRPGLDLAFADIGVDGS